jgi:hypothetical protein
LGFFPGEKWLGNKVDHTHPSSVKVKNEYNYIIAPLYAFRAWTGKNIPTTLADYECSLSWLHLTVRKNMIPQNSTTFSRNISQLKLGGVSVKKFKGHKTHDILSNLWILHSLTIRRGFFCNWPQENGGCPVSEALHFPETCRDHITSY